MRRGSDVSPDTSPEHTPPERPGVRGVLARNLRWRLPPVLLLGAAIAWIDRANLGVAAPAIREDLDISAGTMGAILGSYAFVLIFMHPFSAYLVDRLGGPRILYFVSALAWFVFTSATGLVRGAASLFATRFLLAIGEAPQASCALKATQQWFPRRERALAIGTYEVGSEFGGAIAVPLVTALVAGFGWRLSFVATGVLGLGFAVLWIAFYRSPRQQTGITPGELRHIEADDGAAQDRSERVQWIDLFRYRTVWGLMAVMFCRTSIIFFFVTWFPTYLVDDRGFTLLELGLYGAIPGLAAIVGDLAGGWVSDHLVRRGTRPTLARKAPITAGLLLGTTIALAAVVPSAAGALALLSVSSAGVAFCTGALYALPLEVAPTPGNAISISGLMRAGGLVGGALTPILVGFQFEATGSFVVPLLTAGGLLVVGIAVLLLVVGPAQRLPVKGRMGA